jgi:hypothetical protein
MSEWAIFQNDRIEQDFVGPSYLRESVDVDLH